MEDLQKISGASKMILSFSTNLCGESNPRVGDLYSLPPLGEHYFHEDKLNREAKDEDLVGADTVNTRGGYNNGGLTPRPTRAE